MIARAFHSRLLQSMDLPDRQIWALHNHDHLKSCSCWMCGNPRKWDGIPTIQERRVSTDDIEARLDNEFEEEANGLGNV
jgi:hypothetical protein